MIPKVMFCKECNGNTIHCCRKQKKEEKLFVFCGMMMPRRMPREYKCIRCGIVTRE